MTTVYGRPAVFVCDPTGEQWPYVCHPVPAAEGEWRAWELTKADGTVYRVSEAPNGRFACTCDAFKYGKGRRFQVGKQAVCKHAKGIADEIAQAAPEAVHARNEATNG